MKELRYFWYRQKGNEFVEYGIGKNGFKIENDAVEWVNHIAKLYKEEAWGALLHLNISYYSPPENLILMQKLVDVEESNEVGDKTDDLWERMLSKHCILVGVRDLPTVKGRYEDLLTLSLSSPVHEAYKEILSDLLELLSDGLIISSSGKLSLTSKGEDFMKMVSQVAQFRSDGVL